MSANYHQVNGEVVGRSGEDVEQRALAAARDYFGSLEDVEVNIWSEPLGRKLGSEPEEVTFWKASWEARKK